ncbi:MAG TPA: bifunctional riboflavin kinase/FAD synthetase [Verrucomicrobiae bacterium]|nr:bifunctional riboflavin kinase/FAD synthetase [Verrucomicrobiae bacterium]
MKVIHSAKELQAQGRKVCLAIGMFDGVHLGHQQVIRQAITDAAQHEALSVAVTFDRHPNSVVAPKRVPPLIYSLPQKLRAIAALKTDATLLLEFTKAFSQKTGEQFIRELADEFGRIHSVCVGSSFHFGHRRTGNVSLLQELGKELHFIVHGLSAVSLDGETVSSTRIREAIREGNLDLAGQMLGREYSLAGNVQKGDRLGRKLGIPTANIDIAGLAVPPGGVYAVHCSIGEQSHRAVLNIGYRPTLQNPAPELRVEAHLLDFAGDLYGVEIETTFVEKLRDERKFASLEALQEQIQRDIAQARTLFAQQC